MEDRETYLIIYRINLYICVTIILKIPLIYPEYSKHLYLNQNSCNLSINEEKLNP